MRRIGNRWWAVALAAGVLLGGVERSVACTGDCSGDGEVTVNEIITGVNIALGSASVDGCAAMDANGDGEVSIDEIISAINGALEGCPAVTPQESTPTPTATAIPATATPCGSSDGSASLVATSASPASGQGPLQVSCVTVENAGGERTDLTRVSGRGTVGGVEMLVQVYFVTATGAVENVSYGWSPYPGIPDFYENLPFCSAPDCNGASMDLASRTITLNGTSLAGEGVSAVLNGTITLDRIPDAEPTPTPLGCPGGRADLTFSAVQGAAVPATLALGAAQNFSRPADPPTYAYLSAEYDGCPMPFPRLTLGFQFSGKPIEAGTTYQVGSIDGNLNQIEYREQGFSSSKSWEAKSGSLVVDAVDGGRVTYRIVGAEMRPKDLGTTGTFTLNVAGVLEPAS